MYAQISAAESLAKNSSSIIGHAQYKNRKEIIMGKTNIKAFAANLLRRKIVFTWVAVVALAVIVCVVINHTKNAESKASIVTVASLQKIVNVSELSTFTAVYNGVAKVYDSEDPQEIRYYVSYDAKVNAGIDMEKASIFIDEEKKIINIQLPEVYITDITVQASSMDFIFMDEDDNTNTVVAEAYKYCEEDVRAEADTKIEIKDLARQNAINIFTALTKPFVEQLDVEYTLVIQ